MKYGGASVLLLLMTYPCAAQTRLPLQQRSTPSEQADHEQKSPYEGRTIKSLEFRGNEHFSSETIRKFMNTKEGDPYYTEKLEADKDRLRVLLLGRYGYLKAALDNSEIEEADGGLKIVMPMREGAVYRAGSIVVEGSAVFSPEEVIKIVGLNSGQIVDGYGFQLGVQKLAKLYKNRGYMQFDVGFLPDFKQNSPEVDQGVVDITLELEEGNVFRINAIRFEGNTKTTDQAFRRRLKIREGDTYNESLLGKSLERLNALGLFEEVRPYDAKILSYDDRLDITILLKEKERE